MDGPLMFEFMNSLNYNGNIIIENRVNSRNMRGHLNEPNN
jgi:hypothetical protein